MTEVEHSAGSDTQFDDAGLEETLLAACAERPNSSAIPESLTERLFFVREQMERIDSPPPAGPCLLVSGPGFDPRWFAATDGWSIGRDSTCDLVLTDNRISRRHASLHVDGEDWSISDLQSQNGMRVNGTKVSHCTLHSGDVVEIADYAVIFMA